MLITSNPQQIAAFVVPLLVIIGWITGHDLTLFFADFEVRSGVHLIAPQPLIELV